MPRLQAHPDISGSIVGYVTCYIVHERARYHYWSRLWKQALNRYAAKLRNDWGW